MKSLAVFCGANTGFLPIFKEKTIELAEKLVERDIEIIFGGGSVGLMGVLADTVLARGGRITGVITTYLNDHREVGHKGIPTMYVLENMSVRKIKLLELSEGIINLPGGYGSMDELFEVLTLAQLHEYQHPIGLLNVDGFYDHLIAQIEVMIEKGFIHEQNRGLLLIDETIDGLLNKMQNYRYVPRSSAP
jgi:uncharacterized protein (TIGR00730 family)